MVGTIELDQDGENLLIRFPYRPDLVEQVRTLPGRRWDKGHKVWRVPATHVDAVYLMFSAHRFEFSSEVSGLLAGTVRVKAKDPAKTKGKGKDPAKGNGVETRTVAGTVSESPAASAAGDSLTVSQLNEQVLNSLRSTFPQPVWVVGEIFGLDKNKDRKHLYFSLVEKAAGESRAAAQVDVAMFAGRAEGILSRLSKAPDPVTLRDGIEIRALVRVELYVAKGRFQLIIEDIDPEFTLGKLALDRDKILRELREAGIDKRNSSLPLPRPPLRIGVLSSPDAEGWKDFLRQLEESQLGFAITLHPVMVQGEELKASVLRGLSWFESRAGEFDALCIVRGGGSRTDLAWFDDRDVAFAVARHPVKILCGIGHLRDRSVLDEISHSEKTPTAVAAFLVQQVEEILGDLRRCSLRLADSVRDLVVDRRAELASAASDLRHHVHGRVVAARGHLHSCARVLRTAPGALLRDRVAAELVRSQQRLSRLAFSFLEGLQGRLQSQEQRQRLLDPKRVLARGYAVIHGPDGRIVPDAARMKAGMNVDIQMRDGRARTRVEEVRKET